MFNLGYRRQLNNPEGQEKPNRVAPRDDSYESLRHNHRRGLWPARSGPYLACLRGKPAPGDGPVVRSPHRLSRRSMSLGLALV